MKRLKQFFFHIFVSAFVFHLYYPIVWIPQFIKGMVPSKMGMIALIYSALASIVQIAIFWIYGWSDPLYMTISYLIMTNWFFSLYFFILDVAPGLFGIKSQEGHIRGASIADARDLKKMVKHAAKNDTGQQIWIGGVPIPNELETRSILLSGSPGTGKSMIFKSIVPVIRDRGDILICADPNGDLMKSFYREGDIILNPLDARGVSWSPLAEIEEEWESARLAKAIVPDGVGSHSEWTSYAQSLLTAVIQASVVNPNPTNASLLEALTVMDNATLKKIVAGTPASRFFSDDGKNTMLNNIRGIIGTELTPWSYLDPKAGKSSWSIRQYIQDVAEMHANGEPNIPALWIPYSSNQRALLRPLIGVWLDLISTSIMSLEPNRDRKIMLVIDELPALRKIGSLKETLNEGRKFGICCIAGLQTIAQAIETYGREGAQSLFACFQNVVTLRVTDTETSDYMSLQLGEGEFEEVKESTSVNHEGQESVSTSTNRVPRRVVTASEIQKLPDRHGYLNIAGPTPVCPIEVAVVEPETVTETFIKKLRTA